MKKHTAFFALLAFVILYSPFSAEAALQTGEDKKIEQANKSINHMLARAQIMRGLAAQHHQYILQNRENEVISLVEDAAQVMAYNIICEDANMTHQGLNKIAADVTFKIAVLASNSTIKDQLESISKQASIEARMEFLGDLSTTVLMFEIGRRRGLFDALLTDFGNKRFCAGLKADVRNRYNGLLAEME